MRGKKHKITILDDSDKPISEKPMYYTQSDVKHYKKLAIIGLSILAILLLLFFIAYAWYRNNGIPFVKDKGTIQIGIIEDVNYEKADDSASIVKKVFKHAKGAQGNKIKIIEASVSKPSDTVSAYRKLHNQTACVFLLSDRPAILKTIYGNAVKPVIVPVGNSGRNAHCFNFKYSHSDQIQLIADYSIFIKQSNGLGVLYDPETNQLSDVKLLKKYLSANRKTEARIKHTEAYSTQTDTSLDSQFKRFSNDDIRTVYIPSVNKKQLPSLIKNAEQYKITVLTDDQYRQYTKKYPSPYIYYTSCYQKNKANVLKAMKAACGSTDEDLCLAYEAADMTAKCLKHYQSFNLYWGMYKSKYSGICNTYMFGKGGQIILKTDNDNVRGYVINSVPQQPQKKEG